MKFLEYDNIWNKILNKLDDKSLANVSQVNKKFHSRVRLRKISFNVIEFITQSTQEEIDTHLYLSCPKLDILRVMELSPQFYLNIIKDLIKPFTPVDVINLLLSLPKEQFDINYQGIIGQTLLHLFIYDIDAVRLLIQNGANVNAQDMHEFTALHHGINLPDPELAFQLLTIFAENKFRFGLQDFHRKTVIDIVLDKCSQTQNKDPDILKMISVLPITELLTYLNIKRITDLSLFETILNFNPEYANQLTTILDQNTKILSLQNGKMPVIKLTTEQLEISLQQRLRLQPKEKHFEIIVASILNLLKFGAYQQFSVTIEEFYVVTRKVIGFSDTDMVIALLKQCNVNQPLDKGRSLLNFFILNGDFESVLYLLKSNANVNYQDSSGNTALHLFIRAMDLKDKAKLKILSDLIELFEKYKFTFNLADRNKFTVCELLLSICKNLFLCEELRSALAKLLVLTYINPFDALSQYQIIDETLVKELNILLQNQSLSAELLCFSEPNGTSNLIPYESDNEVFNILQKELTREYAQELSAKLNLQQTLRLLNYYHNFPICNNLKNEPGFNEFLLTIDERIVKQIDEVENKSGLEFSPHCFQLLALLFINIENNPEKPFILKAIIDKCGSLKSLNNSNLDISLMALLIKGWHMPWFTMLSIEQIKSIKIDTLKLISEMDITQQIQMAEIIQRKLNQPQFTDKIDLNFLLSENSAPIPSSQENIPTKAEGITPFRRLSDNLIKTIFSFLNKDTLRNVKKVNRQFKTLSKELMSDILLPKVASNVAELITNCYATEIEGQLYLGCETLNLLSAFVKKPSLYFDICLEIINPLQPAEVIAFLIKHKFALDSQGNLGQTLLHFVICDVEAVKLLIKAKVNVNAQDANGNTAFHYEICRGTIQHIMQLIQVFSETDFDFQIKNFDNKRAIDYLFTRFKHNLLNEKNEKLIQLIMMLPFEEILQFLSNSETTHDFLFEKLIANNPEYTERLTTILTTNQNKKNESNQKIKDIPNIPSSMQFFIRQILENVPPEKHLSVLVTYLLELLVKGCLPSKSTTWNEFYFAVSRMITPFSHRQVIEMILDKCPVNQPLYMNKTLLHFYVVSGDIESTKFLLERDANVNALDAFQRTPLHIVAKEIDVTKNEKRAEMFLSMLLSFRERGFQFNLLDNEGYTVCRHILEKCPKRGVSQNVTTLLSKLLTFTYLNPFDALSYYQIVDEKLCNEINDCLKEQSFSDVMTLFNPPQSSIEYKRPNLPTDPFSQQVYSGMQLKLSDTELQMLQPETQLEIRAYRIIGLITHSWLSVDEDFDWVETATGAKYCSEDNELLGLYREEPKKIIGEFDPCSLINKISELGFDIKKPGSYKQTLLHFFAAFNKPEAITLLIAKGADVNAKEIYGETPLYKIISMLSDTEHRNNVSCNTIKCLINAGAELPARFGQDSLSVYLTNDFLSYLNSEKAIDCVAYLLSNSNDNVIELIKNIHPVSDVDINEKAQLLKKTNDYLEESTLQPPKAKRHKPDNDNVNNNNTSGLSL